MTFSAVGEGIAANAIWASAGSLVRLVIGRQIKITSPRPSETLSDKQPSGRESIYDVTGTLKRLPNGGEIWLLTEDQPSGKVWPQGFYSVLYDAHSQTWKGKISVEGKGPIKIYAVVAPPTSQDFFRYFQKLGPKTQYEPLIRVPLECVNRAHVQARFA